MNTQEKDDIKNYVRYSDEIEVKQPNEDEDSRAVVESMARVNKIMFERYRHAVRDAHAKNHGILRGELEIYDNLPEHLAQGLFKEPRKYPVIIRFSTAPGMIEPDKKSSQRGMAIKIIGVEGEKFLAEDKDALTQDFLLVNYPIIPTGTVKDYLDQQKKVEEYINTPELFQSVQGAMLVAGRKIKNLIGKEDDPNHFSIPGSHILGDRYFSMAAIRYGDYVAKISIAPKSENVASLHGKDMDEDLIKSEPESFLTTIVKNFFENQTAVYELSAQLCTDIEKMPVEDGSVQWMEEDSPFQGIASLTIHPQNTFSPARRVYGYDVLSFNPFHCLPEHRPLGNIMRVRKLAYETSSKYRHNMNSSPRVEPISIDELPD
ncbi:catalase family protein [Chryseobacterium sp. Leaf394]|uniref:catalase family protein n=1 Tax=Chryseobacterium sp. Leaf394 TaxID=1736361 RepID=UPI0006FEED98|nr:catalase family protein [Chryseobacterium sp. Leaf394]KQS92084.1 catalase [Chryseobacterium sp. Leaf394]